MDDKVESVFINIMYCSLIVTLIYVTAQNIANPWTILVLSGLVIASVTLRNALIYPSNYRFAGKLTVLMDIFLVYLIGRLDSSGSSQIFYYILIADIAIAYSFLYSGLVTALCYAAYVIGSYANSGFPPFPGFLPAIAFHSLFFLSVYALMYIAKYEIRQRDRLAETMYQLKVKTKQLENTYGKLKETSEDLEEMTILKERNRIAREIHDTVGHTLTTVLLEMEAGERLLSVNPELSVEKIKLAKAQVRKGLEDIRESVGVLQSGREIMDFIPSVKLLIDETTRHGGIFVKYDISDLPKLSAAQEKALYRALQEGLTNGIKHGKSTAFVFKLKYQSGTIKFSLEDNGTGASAIVQGFGLTAMEERVKELGGIFNISTKYGEGCCIDISIPVKKELANESC